MNHNSLYCNLPEVNSSEVCIFVAYTGKCEVLFLTLIQIKYQRTKELKKNLIN